jgi:hypothetical protein
VIVHTASKNPAKSERYAMANCPTQKEIKNKNSKTTVKHPTFSALSWELEGANCQNMGSNLQYVSDKHLKHGENLYIPKIASEKIENTPEKFSESKYTG